MSRGLSFGLCGSAQGLLLSSVSDTEPQSGNCRALGKKGTENMLRVMGLCACLESEAAALRQKELLAFLGFSAPVSDYTLK